MSTNPPSLTCHDVELLCCSSLYRMRYTAVNHTTKYGVWYLWTPEGKGQTNGERYMSYLLPQAPFLFQILSFSHPVHGSNMPSANSSPTPTCSHIHISSISINLFICTVVLSWSVAGTTN